MTSARDATDPMRCGAKTRQGGRCRAKRMANGRCRLHGGKSTGPRTWSQGGRYSKKLSEFRARLQGLAIDPALLQAGVLEKLALLDETENSLLERALEQGDTPELRTRALALAKASRSELRGDEGTWVPEQLDDLVALLAEGVRYDQLLVEASKIATKRVAATTDLRRTMANESVAQERLAFYVHQVMRVIYEVVRDQLPPGKAEDVVREVHLQLTRSRRVRELPAETACA